MLQTEYFGSLLRELRSEKGYTQRQLADLMVVSHATVANWEVGKRLPDISMLSRLAQCLGVESYILLDALRGSDQPPKIIVVEDVSVILKGAVRTIGETLLNAEVYGFRSSAEALDFAHANRVAVAFLDIELAGESGIELAVKLREIKRSTNIVFLTCHREYALDALNTFCSGFILKPLTAEKLNTVMDNLRFPIRGGKPL